MLGFLDLDELSRRRLEGRIARNASMCGCSAATMAVLAVLALLLVNELVDGQRLRVPGLASSIVWVGLPLLAAVVTKVLAVGWSRIALGHAYRRVERLATTTPSQR